MTRTDGLGAPGPGRGYLVVGVLLAAIGVALIGIGVTLPGGLNILAAGAWIGAHPWFRARWYRTGYADGYVDGRSEPRPRSVTCPRCGRTSYNRNDIRAGYCGNCHAWTSPPCESAIGDRR